MYRFTSFFGLPTIVLIASSSSADFLEFSDQAEWQSATNQQFDTIGFVFEDVEYEVVTDQYAEQGVLFPQGDDWASESLNPNATTGGWALRGSFYTCPLGDCGDVRILFDSPQQWIGLDHGGATEFLLYNNGDLLYNSYADGFGFPSSGSGLFAGIVSSVPFD